MGVEAVDDAFQFVELLAGFSEFAYGGEALVVVEVFAGFGGVGIAGQFGVNVFENVTLRECCSSRLG